MRIGVYMQASNSKRVRRVLMLPVRLVSIRWVQSWHHHPFICIYVFFFCVLDDVSNVSILLCFCDFGRWTVPFVTSILKNSCRLVCFHFHGSDSIVRFFGLCFRNCHEENDRERFKSVMWQKELHIFIQSSRISAINALSNGNGRYHQMLADS